MKAWLCFKKRGIPIASVLALSAATFAQELITVGGHVVTANHKPIPNVTITASGLETAPAVTDSSGVYVITIKTAAGRPVHFHLERPHYNSLDSTTSIAPPLPTDFTMQAVQSVTPNEALVSLHKGLNAVDKPYRELDCQTPPCATTYLPFPVAVQTRADVKGDIQAIEFVHQGGATGAPGSIFGTISLADISKLSPEQRVLILVYEEGVTTDYALWSSLSSKLKAGVLRRAEQVSTASRLVVAGEDMCGNFGNLLDVLQDINVQVWDHYWGIKSVCDRFSQSHIGG